MHIFRHIPKIRQEKGRTNAGISRIIMSCRISRISCRLADFPDSTKNKGGIRQE